MWAGPRKRTRHALPLKALLYQKVFLFGTLVLTNDILEVADAMLQVSRPANDLFEPIIQGFGFITFSILLFFCPYARRKHGSQRQIKKEHYNGHNCHRKWHQLQQETHFFTSHCLPLDQVILRKHHRIKWLVFQEER